MAESKFSALFKQAPQAEAADRVEQASPARPPGRPIGRPPGKRSDPAWKQYSILLRRETQRATADRLRDTEGAPDLSGLVQQLLEAWLKKGKM